MKLGTPGATRRDPTRSVGTVSPGPRQWRGLHRFAPSRLGAGQVARTVSPGTPAGTAQRPCRNAAADSGRGPGCSGPPSIHPSACAAGVVPDGSRSPGCGSRCHPASRCPPPCPSAPAATAGRRTATRPWAAPACRRTCRLTCLLICVLTRHLPVRLQQRSEVRRVVPNLGFEVAAVQVVDDVCVDAADRTVHAVPQRPFLTALLAGRGEADGLGAPGSGDGLPDPPGARAQRHEHQRDGDRLAGELQDHHRHVLAGCGQCNVDTALPELTTGPCEAWSSTLCGGWRTRAARQRRQGGRWCRCPRGPD